MIGRDPDETRHLAYFVKRESEGTRPTAEPDSAKICFTVSSISRRRSFPWGYRASLTTGSDCLDRKSRSLGEFPIFHRSLSRILLASPDAARLDQIVDFAPQRSPAPIRLRMHGYAVVRRRPNPFHAPISHP